MKDIFISFSSQNTDEAIKICNFLEENGYSCFISTRDLISGEEYAMQLIENLDQAKAVVLLLSKGSNDSPHVLREIEYAVGHKIHVLVYVLEEVTLSKSMEYFLMTHQWITKDGNQNKKLLDGIDYITSQKLKPAAPLPTPSPAQVPAENSKNNSKNIIIILIAIIVILLMIGVFFMGKFTNNTTQKDVISSSENYGDNNQNFEPEDTLVADNDSNQENLTDVAEASNPEVESDLEKTDVDINDVQPSDENVEATKENDDKDKKKPSNGSKKDKDKNTNEGSNISDSNSSTPETITPSNTGSTPANNTVSENNNQTSTGDSKKDKPSNNNNKKDKNDKPEGNEKDDLQAFKIGDTVSFGSYLDSPINWRVIDITSEKNYVLISQDILCLKTFDAAEGGEYNYYNGNDYWSYANHIIEDEDISIHARGNNDWSKSNIRTWLNSDKEVVVYNDQAPTKTAVGNGYYNTEAGFLYGFTQSEKDALVLTTIQTPANTFSENASKNSVTTKDYVYLLSSEELKLLSNAGMHIYAKPSEACVKNDKTAKEYTSFQSAYGTDSYYYWLRDHSSDCKINEAYFVVTDIEDGYTYLPSSVGICNYGVRPVITVKPSKELIAK